MLATYLRLSLTIAALACFGEVSASAQSTSVLTHHYDSGRTGWNQKETILTPQNVAAQFRLLFPVYLDAQVDAQPLIAPNQSISGYNGTYQVVYVATENNSIYAINAANGNILAKRNYGPAVPRPLDCDNNQSTVGITGTPVIDPDQKSLYFIAYTLNNGAPTYTFHSVNLSDLNDNVPPVTVVASHTLKDGSKTNFNATYQRQRAALLYSGGVIYAGFASFCDFSANKSRGWLLGWKANSLTPLPANELDNRLVTSPNSFFLSSIWMSGSGIAADESGYLYFATGNSDFIGNTYDGAYNIENSVVKVPPSLQGVTSIFTPSNVAFLDKYDLDLGGGGLLKVPTNAAGSPPLIVQHAKDGRIFVLNSNSLGGYTPNGPDNVVSVQTQGSFLCWCAPSYFMGSDGVGRIVTSGGYQVNTWKIKQSSTSTQILPEAGVNLNPWPEDPGFFTTVSSNGTQPGSAIIWAVSRAGGANNVVSLYAFSAAPINGSLPLLGLYAAGFWPRLSANSNIVPVVANGQVYVASSKQLMIFGLKSTSQILPDVIVKSVSYSPSTGLFDSVVTNQGQVSTPAGAAIGVAYDVDGTKVSCGWVAGPLAAGASVTIGSQCEAYQMPPGTHTIMAIADDVNRFAESDKTNNTLSVSYNMANQTLPDLVVRSLLYSSSTGLFNSVVANQGRVSTPAGVAIGVAYDVDGAKVSCGWVAGPLAGGASVTIGSQCAVYQMPPGTHTITAIADDANRVAEADETNNTLSEFYEPANSAVPILVVASLSYSSSTGLFTSVVANQGQVPTPTGVTVGVAYNVDGAKVSCGWVTGPLAAGASVTIGSQCATYQMPSGTHTVTAIPDDVDRFPSTDINLSQSISIP